jgi:hypothetical protein
MCGADRATTASDARVRARLAGLLLDCRSVVSGIAERRVSDDDLASFPAAAIELR